MIKPPETNHSQEEIITILNSLLEVNLSPKHREQVEHYIELARKGVEITLREATKDINLFSK